MYLARRLRSSSTSQSFLTIVLHLVDRFQLHRRHAQYLIPDRGPRPCASSGSFSTPASVVKTAFSRSSFAASRCGAVGRLAPPIDLIENLIIELELVGDLRELGPGRTLVLDAIMEIEDRALGHGPSGSSSRGLAWPLRRSISFPGSISVTRRRGPPFRACPVTGSLTLSFSSLKAASAIAASAISVCFNSPRSMSALAQALLLGDRQRNRCRLDLLIGGIGGSLVGERDLLDVPLLRRAERGPFPSRRRP